VHTHNQIAIQDAMERLQTSQILRLQDITVVFTEITVVVTQITSQILRLRDITVDAILMDLTMVFTSGLGCR